jgi:hypothetical protein
MGSRVCLFVLQADERAGARGYRVTGYPLRGERRPLAARHRFAHPRRVADSQGVGGVRRGRSAIRITCTDVGASCVGVTTERRLIIVTTRSERSTADVRMAAPWARQKRIRDQTSRRFGPLRDDGRGLIVLPANGETQCHLRARAPDRRKRRLQRPAHSASSRSAVVRAASRSSTPPSRPRRAATRMDAVHVKARTPPEPGVEGRPVHRRAVKYASRTSG